METVIRAFGAIPMEPILREALKAINNRNNVATGLSHPNDMNATKELFMLLHRNGVILTKAEIAAWANANGWDTEDADELGSLAEQIGMGKRVRFRDSWWRSDIVQHLRELADADE